MEMRIEIVKVSPVYMDGKYPKLDIIFNRDGKVNNRKLVGVGKTKDVLESIKGAKEGDIYDIELEKSEPGADGKSYWNWNKATKAAAQVAAEVAKTTYQTKSTYETPEERAKKQVYIVRQSSLNTANEYLVAQGKKFSLGELKVAAQDLVDFVFQTERLERATDLAQAGMKTVDGDMQDDIPF